MMSDGNFGASGSKLGGLGAGERGDLGFLEWKALESGVFTEGAKIKIGVVGISAGAGATFVASRIAYELGRQCDGVCYVEAGKGERLAVNSLSMAGVYRREKFTDYFAAWDEGLAAGCKVNLFENVNWVLRASEPASLFASDGLGEAGWSGERSARRPRSLREELATPRPALGRIPFERIPGRYMVVDSPAPATMQEMDLMLCIVDPLPSAVMAGSGRAAALRDNRIRTARGFGPAMNDPTPCLWVLNKDNPRVAHRELERYLKVKFDFVIPMIDPSEFYRAEYSAMPIFKAIARPGGDDSNGRAQAVTKTSAIAARIRALLPIF